MLRFLPLMMGVMHAVCSFLALILSIAIDVYIFSDGYIWGVILIPGGIVPLGIILYSVLTKNSSWWIVVLGCVASVATTLAHITLIGAASTVV